MASYYLKYFPLMETVAQEIISRLSVDANQECRSALVEYMEMEDMIFEQVKRGTKDSCAGSALNTSEGYKSSHPFHFVELEA